MALAHAKITYELREVVLRDKPQDMINKSAKATVPVLILCGGTSEETVIDESLEIMHWSLDNADPKGWRDFSNTALDSMADLVERTESEFKPLLDRYKYAVRFPESTAEQYRLRATEFLNGLESQLQAGDKMFLFGERLSYADVALFPFIRQFANVDLGWFEQAPYPALRTWLEQRLQQPEFVAVMNKYSPWKPGQAPLYFNG